MSDDRVATLESRIRELEASLNGLTDELVDTKDRLATVEEATGEDTMGREADIVEGGPLGDDGETMDSETGEVESETAGKSETDPDGNAETDTGTERESEDPEVNNGIIVA